MDLNLEFDNQVGGAFQWLRVIRGVLYYVPRRACGRRPRRRYRVEFLLGKYYARDRQISIPIKLRKYVKGSPKYKKSESRKASRKTSRKKSKSRKASRKTSRKKSKSRKTSRNQR